MRSKVIGILYREFKKGFFFLMLNSYFHKLKYHRLKNEIISSNLSSYFICISFI